MAKSDEASRMMCDGFSCSQSVVATFAERFGIDRETALRIGMGFGGGIGRQGDTCGALTGGVVVLGLANVPGSTDNKVAKEETYQRVVELTERFEQRFGARACRDLLGHDLSKPAEYAQAKAENLFRNRCPHFVAGVAELLEAILDEG